MENHKTMGLALVCSDGRLHQEGVHYNKQLAEHLGVELVDVVAVPGPDGLFKPEQEDNLAAVLSAMNLLIDAHHPTAVAIAGHYDCAGNAVSDAEHDEDAKNAAKKFKAELGFDGAVVAISTVRHSNDEWSLKEAARF